MFLRSSSIKHDSTDKQTHQILEYTGRRERCSPTPDLELADSAPEVGLELALVNMVDEEVLPRSRGEALFKQAMDALSERRERRQNFLRTAPGIYTRIPINSKHLRP